MTAVSSRTHPKNVPVRPSWPKTSQQATAGRGRLPCSQIRLAFEAAGVNISRRFSIVTNCRHTNWMSTRFFVCVKNMSKKEMSRCVNYQESGEGVGVGFCHSCHGVKMREKHLGFLEYTRVHPTMFKQTRVQAAPVYFFYCTPSVCVPDVIGALAVWRLQTKKKVLSRTTHTNGDPL